MSEKPARLRASPYQKESDAGKGIRFYYNRIYYKIADNKSNKCHVLEVVCLNNGEIWDPANLSSRL